LLLAFATVAWARPRDGAETTTTVDWAWARIRNGEIADFYKRCGDLDSHAEAGWDNKCRRIPARVLVEMLTNPKWQGPVRRYRIRLRGVLIDGTVDLSDADITPEVWVDRSKIEGDLNIAGTRWQRPLSLRGTVIVGNLLAPSMRAESDIELNNHAAIEGDVILVGAAVGGTLDMRNSSFAKLLGADQLGVAGSMMMSNATFDGDVRLVGAKIGGQLVMDDSSFSRKVAASSLKVGRELFMGDAKFSSNVDLAGAHIDGIFLMDNSSFSGALDLRYLSVAKSLFMGGGAKFGNEVTLRAAKVTDDLFLSGSSFAGSLDLLGTKVGGILSLDGSSFADVVNGGSLVVGGNFFMSHSARFGGEVILEGGKVGGNLEMGTNSWFGKTVDADALSVAGGLFMRGARFGGEMVLRRARIGANLETFASLFGGRLDADSLNVAGNLFMRDTWFGGEANLRGAKVGGFFEMGRSFFGRTFTGESISVEGSVTSHQARFAANANLNNAKIGGILQMDNSLFFGNISLVDAKVSGFLDLHGATGSVIDLTGAVGEELLLNNLGWWCPVSKSVIGSPLSSGENAKAPSAHWPLGNRDWQNARCNPNRAPGLPMLILRNAHFDAFQDSDDAWPPSLDLEGFHYDRLGGPGGVGRYDMRQRSSEQWADWLARNRTFSTQPYTELSSVLLAAGHRDKAETIQAFGRERERAEAWAHGDYGSWVWLTLLGYIVGYGIGLYTFSVVIWVVGLSAFGADLLWYSPIAREGGYLWRFGASLHRLLPIVTLSKEFEIFFDEPSNLNRWQCRYFAIHALLGWGLGLFLLAAMGGLIQNG
jgi:hypothetical protein